MTMVPSDKEVADAIEFIHKEAPQFVHGDCSQCGDEEVLLQKSEDEEQPLHYVCKECFLRGL